MRTYTYVKKVFSEEGICLSTFFGLFLVDLGLLFRYASTYPVSDDWGWMKGTSPSVIDAITHSAQSHYAPLSNLLFWGTTQFGRGNMKFILLLSLASVAASCGYVLMEVRESRGTLQLADAFVPLVMLNPGLSYIYMWATGSFQAFAFALFVLILPFVLMPPSEGRGRRRRSTVAFIALMLLPMQGSTGGILGAVSVAAVSLKLLFEKYEYTYAWASVFVALCFVFLGVYVPDSSTTVPHKDIYSLVFTFLSVLSAAFASAGTRLATPLGILILLLTLISIYQLSFREYRTENIGLSRVAYVLAPVAVAFVIALFRSGARPVHSAASVPLLVAVYVSISFYAAEHTREFWSKGMFFIAAVPLLYNSNLALDTARGRQEWSNRLRSDIQENMSIQKIAARHADYWIIGKEDRLRESLLWAKSNGLYNLDGVRSDSLEFRRIPVERTIVGADIVDGFVELSGGRKDRIEWTLETPVEVRAVRFTYRKGEGRPPELRFAWLPSDYDSAFSAVQTWPFKIEARTARRVIEKTIFIDKKISALSLFSKKRRSVLKVEALRFALKK